MCRRFFFFLFLIVIGLAAGFVYYVHETATPHVFPNPKAIPPREAQAAQNRLERALGLGQPIKARTASNSSATNSAQTVGRTITIHLSENDINTTIATNPDIKRQLTAHGIQAAQFAFAPPNLVTIYVKIVYHKEPADADVTGALSPDSDGGLQYIAQEVKVSGVPVPLKSAQPVIAKAAAILLPKADSGLPLQVQKIDIQGNTIYLTGPAKKRPVIE